MHKSSAEAEEVTMFKTVNLLLIVALLPSTVAFSGASNAAAVIDPVSRQQVVEAAARELNARYVFPDVAKRVETTLSQNIKNKAYDGIDDAIKFAERLTEDIQAVTHDKHIRVRYSEKPIPERVRGEPSAEDQAEFRRQAAARNFGVERVERLPANIGYIELRGFEPADLAGEAIAAAMTLLANTDALIIDLRRNGGGDPSTVALMSSYLFDERTHLNSFYNREGDRTTQYWTQDWVPGKRFGKSKPIYVLTAKRTFSAAEEFSYNLKNLKRGTIVGETTGGGAHPGGLRRLNAHFSVFVPDGRAINPITKTNWEGVGVEPDVKVPPEDALRTAQLLALKTLQGRADQDSNMVKLIAQRIEDLEKTPPTQ
jgi:hypothetical protein